MNTETINGSDLMVFAEKGGKLQSIAFATNHQLQVTMDTKNTSTKDNGNGMWNNFEAGLMSWTMQTENLMSATTSKGLSMNDLFDMMLSRTPVNTAFSLQKNNIDYTKKLDEEFVAPDGGWTPDETNMYKGKALVTSFQMNAQNGEKSTASATFTGCGNLQKIGNGIQKAATVAAPVGNPVATVSAAVETAAIRK